MVGYMSKSEYNRFWYENIYKKPYDHIYYQVRDRYLKVRRDIRHDHFASREVYSVTRPDRSY